MLLRALYDLAQQRRLFEHVHLQDRDIHFLVPIDMNGELVGDGLLPLYGQDKDGRTILGRSLRMPRFPGENNGGKAYFLAESCTAILGIDKQTGTGLVVEGKRLENAAKSFLHFWERIKVAYEATKLPGLQALLCFRERYLTAEGGKLKLNLPFLEVRSSESGRATVGARTSAGGWERLTKATRVPGERESGF